MALDYEYGINIGNRFFDLTGHDEDPDEFIANQSTTEEKSKQSTTESKTTTKKSASKKSPASGATAVASSTTTSVTTTVANTKLNKENVTPKPVDTEQKQLRSKSNTDNDTQKEQPTRVESSRGGRSFRRGGSSSGRGRPPYEDSNRGGGQQRSDRTNRYAGSAPRNYASGFEQSANTWSNEADHVDQQSRDSFVRGRGRGGGRGRGRGGRGHFYNRPQEVVSQDQQPPNPSGFEQTDQSSFDNVQSELIQLVAQGFEVDATTPQEQFIQPEESHRGRGRGRGRGHYGPRVFRNSRNYPGDRENQREDYQQHYRQNRRQHDREQRSFDSTIKPAEKKGGEGAHNWGSPTENPENVEPIVDTKAVDQPSEEAPATVSKDWAKQVDEAEEMMTLDEYKKKKEAQKQSHQEKILPLRRREANDGVVVKEWQDPNLRYQKKDDDGVSDEDEEHEDSDKEVIEGEEEATVDQAGRKKLISIPLHFTRFDRPRSFGDSRGGRRHEGGGRFHEQQRLNSPNQQVPSSQQAGEYQSDHQQTRPYRGRPRQSFGRGEFRRAYSNAPRGSRQGYNRSNADPNTPDFANTNDFPTLHTTKT